MPRTYSQDEVREIIRRAADATAERERRESENSGLTLDDLRDLASSTGIDPEVMTEAARSLDREVDEPFEKRLMGLKISAAHAIRLEGPFTDEDWQALVADCRRTFGAKGKLHDVSGLREWSNGNLHVLVEPTGDDVVIRMRTHNGVAQNMMPAGVAMSIAFIAMMISALGDGRPASDLFGAVMVLVAALFGAGALGYTRLKSWSRTRESQMEAIGRRMEQRKRSDASASSPALESASTQRIELPDEPTAEQEAVLKTRQQER